LDTEYIYSECDYYSSNRTILTIGMLEDAIRNEISSWSPFSPVKVEPNPLPPIIIQMNKEDIGW
jgi:hypothetical protein